jgi:hypothetical protein
MPSTAAFSNAIKRHATSGFVCATNFTNDDESQVVGWLIAHRSCGVYPAEYGVYTVESSQVIHKASGLALDPKGNLCKTRRTISGFGTFVINARLIS